MANNRDGFLTESLGMHGFLAGEPVGQSRSINWAGDGVVVEYDVTNGWFNVTIGAVGGGLPSIADSRALLNISGAVAQPIATTAATFRGWLNVANGATANAGTVTGVAATAPLAVDVASPNPTLSIVPATDALPGSMSAADKKRAIRDYGFRTVTHAAGSATDVLTPTSVRYQRVNMTGGNTYTIELDTAPPVLTGATFILDVSVAPDPAVTNGIEIYNGIGGSYLGGVFAFESDTRDVLFEATFNGTAWMLTPIGDGNRQSGIDYNGLPINDTGTQAGDGPEKANWDHSHAHGNRGGGTLHAAATASANGFQTAANFKKQSDGGGVAYREKLALDLTGVGAYTDMVDGATTDIPVAASTSVLIEAHLSCYRKVVYSGEGGPATVRESFVGTFRGEALRDAANTPTPLVGIEPSTGDTVWVLGSTSGKTIKVKPIAVSGGFKLQVIGEQISIADYAGAISITSAALNIAATVNTYPVATIA
jgi:hypothetical protein